MNSAQALRPVPYCSRNLLPHSSCSLLQPSLLPAPTGAPASPEREGQRDKNTLVKQKKIKKNNRHHLDSEPGEQEDAGQEGSKQRGACLPGPRARAHRGAHVCSHRSGLSGEGQCSPARLSRQGSVSSICILHSPLWMLSAADQGRGVPGEGWWLRRRGAAPGQRLLGLRMEHTESFLAMTSHGL